jgi:hypothetical protein
MICLTADQFLKPKPSVFTDFHFKKVNTQDDFKAGSVWRCKGNWRINFIVHMSFNFKFAKSNVDNIFNPLKIDTQR